jgi:hypothetical protein
LRRSRSDRRGDAVVRKALTVGLGPVALPEELWRKASASLSPHGGRLYVRTGYAGLRDVSRRASAAQTAQPQPMPCRKVRHLPRRAGQTRFRLARYSRDPTENGRKFGECSFDYRVTSISVKGYPQ